VKIGIIGNGFVGSAIASGFGLHADVSIYDVSPEKSLNSFEDTVTADFVFVSVPTPMSLKKKNEIDLNIITSVFQRISECESLNRDTIFLIQSF
jgi:UDP-glucose 6-dehydrogenase